MSVSAGFVELMTELLVPLGSIRVRRMFGGAGVYCQGVMFALITDDVLFLKTDDANRPAFEAEHMKPFAYQGKNGQVAIMSYWKVPERLLDNSDEFLAWAQAALAVAHRAANASPKRTVKRN